MIDQPLVREFARRANVSHDHAQSLLEVLDEIARDRQLLRDLATAAGTEVPDSPGPDGIAPGNGQRWTAGYSGAPRRIHSDTDACAYVPSSHEVDALIAAAERHPLGLRFLVEGHLGTVAITFRTHAFTVDAARQRLRGPGR